ncbi:hypothetical protein DV737_g3748, partial [Chaetothyriales sp. CBS 132003]
MQRDLGPAPTAKNPHHDLNVSSRASRTPSVRARAAAHGSVDVSLSGTAATSLLAKFARSPAAARKESTASLATMSSVDNIVGLYLDGPRHASVASKSSVQSASTLYQHIHDMSNKRIATLNYMRRVHQGHTCWFNTVHFSHSDISRLPSYSPARLARRATNYMLLGMSIPAVLDVYPPPHPQNRPAANANLAGEYLRALHALLTEFEAFQQLHPADGSSTSSLARARIPHMFKRSVSGRPRKSSTAPVADIGAPLPQSAGLGGGLADAPSQAASFDSSSTYSNSTLCDVLIDAYQRLQQLLCSPAICTPALSDSFSKVDARLRKVMVGGIVREFEQASREAARREVVGLQRVVLGGLMG